MDNVRYQGRIVEWHDARGFGFIAPNGGGAKVFVHISAMAEAGPRPSPGILVTYEVGESIDGRVRAQHVRLVHAGSSGRRGGSMPLVPALAVVVALAIVAYVAWVRVSHPNSTIQSSVYKTLFARDALDSASRFQCSPEKSSCSQMSSCAEALFHLERCAVPGMDGDHDGIPCERQWCN